MIDATELHSLARDIEGKVRDIRRTVHQNPEIGFQERETAALVSTTLADLGVDHETGVATTGVVATLPGSGPGRVVALRADMDALQKEEAVDAATRPWRSRRSGVMHACGHDGHVAVLLGTAELLARLKDRFRGTVKLFFQPAEEGGGGGGVMVEEGVMKDPDVEAVFALHGWPSLPCGHVGLKHGTSMAMATRFCLELEGLSGHAAYPHRCADPVPAAAAVISSLQTIRSREINPNVGSVVSLTILESGSRPEGAAPCRGELRPSQANIIPQVVRIHGTSRALTLEGQALQLRRIGEISEAVGSAHRCKVTFDAEDGYPPTINDDAMVDLVEGVARRLLGEERLYWLPEPSMGGEDFSYYLQTVPGCIFRLGVARGSTDEELAREPALHSDAFDFNDEALVPGMVMMTGTALEFLGREG